MIFLLIIAYGGRAVVEKLRFAANPYGPFKKIFGIILLLVGLMIFFSWDKVLEAKIIKIVADAGFEQIFLLESMFLDPIEMPK